MCPPHEPDGPCAAHPECLESHSVGESRPYSASRGALRRAIRSSCGCIADMTAAKTTSAQPTEITSLAPTSIPAAPETGVMPLPNRD